MYFCWTASKYSTIETIFKNYYSNCLWQSLEVKSCILEMGAVALTSQGNDITLTQSEPYLPLFITLWPITIKVKPTNSCFAVSSCTYSLKQHQSIRADASISLYTLTLASFIDNMMTKKILTPQSKASYLSPEDCSLQENHPSHNC